MKDLLTEIAEGAVSPWRPIETAPKPGDGEPMISVLLAWTCCKEDGSTAYQVGEGYWHASGGAYGEADWWWAGTSPGDYYADPISQSITGKITHWMPLPKPPTPTTQEAGHAE